MTSIAVTPPILDTVELPPDVAHQRVLNEREAAKFLSLSPISLERLRKSGSGPRHVQLTERRLGYRISSLLQWLNERAAAGEVA